MGRSATINIVVVPLFALFVTGCMGPADSFGTHAPLRIIGKVRNSRGDPVADQSIKIGVAPFTKQSELIPGSIDNSLVPYESIPNYILVLKSKTDTNGAFAFSVPEREYNHPAAFIGFIVIGGGTANDIYMVVSEDTSDSPIYMARLHRRRLILNRVNKTTQELEAVSKLGEHPEIAGKAKRSKKEDVVTLTLTVP